MVFYYFPIAPPVNVLLKKPEIRREKGGMNAVTRALGFKFQVMTFLLTKTETCIGILTETHPQNNINIYG